MTTIKTYQKLKQYIKAFGNKRMNLLVVLSSGGLGKTSIALDALTGKDPLLVSGHITPLAMYKELYEKNKSDMNSLVIFDDVDALLANKTNVALLKQVCDSREFREVKYFSTRITDKQGSLPPEFSTSCKVLMLMNKIQTKDENLNALLSRGHIVRFEPGYQEIIKYMSEYAQDKEILTYIKTFAPLAKDLNLRIYNMAEELKLSGLDWREETINNMQVDPKLLVIHDLMQKYDSDAEREKAFEQQGHGARATYYRYKKIYQSK